MKIFDKLSYVYLFLSEQQKKRLLALCYLILCLALIIDFLNVGRLYLEGKLADVWYTRAIFRSVFINLFISPIAILYFLSRAVKLLKGGAVKLSGYSWLGLKRYSVSLDTELFIALLFALFAIYHLLTIALPGKYLY